MTKKNQMEKVNLKTLPLGQSQFYELNSNENAWVAGIIEEAQENSTPDPSVESVIGLSLEIVRQHTSRLGDYLLVEGSINSTYQLPCVRCLENSVLQMDSSFSLCILNEDLEKEPEFEELDSYVIGKKEYQLYYTESRQLNLKDTIHEQYFMNVEYLPLHDENCLGLCSECGINRNLESCPKPKTCPHIRQ